MSTQDKVTTKATSQRQTNSKSGAKKENKGDSLHARATRLFADLGIRYTMDSFRFIVDNDIKLDSLLEATPRNTHTLVQLGIEGHDSERAFELIFKWQDTYKLSYKTLHNFCIEAAKATGFFISERDIEVLSVEAEKNPESLNQVLQTVLPTLSGAVNSMLSLTQEET